MRIGSTALAQKAGSSNFASSLPEGMRLAFDTVETVRSFDESWTAGDGGQRIGRAFACEDPAEVDRRYAELFDAGYEGDSCTVTSC